MKVAISESESVPRRTTTFLNAVERIRLDISKDHTQSKMRLSEGQRSSSLDREEREELQDRIQTLSLVLKGLQDLKNAALTQDQKLIDHVLDRIKADTGHNIRDLLETTRTKTDMNSDKTDAVASSQSLVVSKLKTLILARPQMNTTELAKFVQDSIPGSIVKASLAVNERLNERFRTGINFTVTLNGSPNDTPLYYGVYNYELRVFTMSPTKVLWEQY